MLTISKIGHFEGQGNPEGWVGCKCNHVSAFFTYQIVIAPLAS